MIAYFLILAGIGAIHITQGVALLFDPSAAWTTSMAAIHNIFDNQYVEASWLIGAGACALLAGLIKPKTMAWKISALFLAALQMFTLIVAATSAVVAIEASAFADGVVRPRMFILADQTPYIWLAVTHAGAMIWAWWHDTS